MTPTKTRKTRKPATKPARRAKPAQPQEDAHAQWRRCSQLGQRPPAHSGDLRPPGEVESPEWLEKQGWERLTWTMDSDRAPDGTEEREIMRDPQGRLWMVSDWHGESGIPHRAARRQISRAEALAAVAFACIPPAFLPDFRAVFTPSDNGAGLSNDEAKAAQLCAEWNGDSFADYLKEAIMSVVESDLEWLAGLANRINGFSYAGQRERAKARKLYREAAPIMRRLGFNTFETHAQN